MTRWNLSQYALSVIVSAAFLAACGGSQPPIAPGAMVQRRAIRKLKNT